jgi:hypothetical protein
MVSQTVDATPQKVKTFMDIPTAASLAGFSLRHFRRIIEEDAIPIVQIGRKFFILGKDFTSWEASKKSVRISAVCTLGTDMGGRSDQYPILNTHRYG